MNRVNGSPFSDATNENQLVLFARKPRFDILRKQIFDRFRGREASVVEVETFVLSETAFRETHYKSQVLKPLELSDPPLLQVIGAGKDRRRGTTLIGICGCGLSAKS